MTTEIQNLPKFKIKDQVRLNAKGQERFWGKLTFKGSIWDIWINQPENQLKTEDGELIYNVRHDNGRGRMVMSYDFKESELILDI